MSSPADRLREALVQGTVGARPGVGATWPVFVGHLPDAPDSAICVYNTTGIRQGRLMRTGEGQVKPGWQVRVRAKTGPEAWAKVAEVQRFLDTVRRLVVVVGGLHFRIDSITQTGTALALGQETDAARRENVTINGTITSKEIST